MLTFPTIRSIGATIPILLMLIFSQLHAADFASNQKAVSECLIDDAKRHIDALGQQGSLGVPDPAGNGASGPKLKYQAIIDENQKIIDNIGKPGSPHYFGSQTVSGTHEAKIAIKNDMDRIDQADQNVTSYQAMIDKKPEQAKILQPMLDKFRADAAQRPQVEAWKVLIDALK